MNRATFLRITGVGGVGALTSCQALDNLDTSAGAMGTGIQFTGLIKVLAKYPASASQKRTAKIRGGRAQVELALKPAYEKREATIRATSETRERSVEKNYRKQLSAAKKMPPSESAAAVASVQASREKGMEEIRAATREQGLALRTAWHRETSRLTEGTYVPKENRPKPGAVDASKVKEETAALMADFRKRDTASLLAVQVPKGGSPTESNAAESVMVYNTRTSQLKDNLVYVLADKPKVGREAKFDDVSAVYVGAVVS